MKNEEDSSSKGHVEVAGGSGSGGAFCGGFYCGGEGKNEEGRGVGVSTKVKARGVGAAASWWLLDVG